MTIADILVETERLGVSLRATPDGVLLAKPIQAVPPNLRAVMQERKAELVRYLHAKAIAKEAEAQGRDLTDNLCDHAPDLLHETVGSITPAESLLGTCARHDVALKLDDDGTLVVNCEKAQGLTPGDWQALKTSLEAHVKAVAQLVAAGWQLRADVKPTTAS